MIRRFHPQTPAALLIPLVTALGMMLVGAATPASASQAESSRTSSSIEFLYQIAREYRRTGQYDEAAHALRKVLLLDPTHRGALRELGEIEELQRTQREQAMDRVLADMQSRLDQPAPGPADWRGFREEDERALAKFRSQSEALTRRLIPGTAPGRGSPVRAPRLSPVVRAPDASVNGVRWFYVFGKHGKSDYGALGGAHVTFVEVPRTTDAAARIRILDADIRGKHDEMAGGWNTATAFRVYGGATLLDTRVVGPESPDGTVVDFGPFLPEQGEVKGGQTVFRLEAEGLDGDDNNLFAYEVSPPTAQVFSFQPAIRLAKEAGAEMRFFPAIPSGATRVTEANYDLDADGGRVSLTRRTTEGKPAGTVQLAGSGSESWAATGVDACGADGARWTYCVTKGTQRNANMAFQMTDQQGQSLPIYTTRGSGGGFTLPSGVGTPGRSCNTFTFDASSSSDPDNDALTYAWDLGDGRKAEGSRVTHTYAAAGDYRVVLEVTDTSSQPCGVSRAEQVVHVNTPPTAVLEAPAAACAAGGVRFSAAKSSDSPGEALRYRWDFGDGATAEGAEVTHAFVKGGAYLVQLVVDDGRGTSCSTDRATAAVRVNGPPVVSVEQEATMCAASGEPLAVILSAVGSSDPDFDTLRYRWDFGDGTTGEGSWASHVYPRGGRYTAVVTVDDGTGTACSTAAAAVSVRVNRAPQAAMRPVGRGCLHEPMAFDASRSSDADGDPLTYRWDFGDGTTEEGAVVQRTFATRGEHPVTLTVDDGSGMSCGTVTSSVTASVNAPPVARMVIHGEDASP
jgi:PKD repeat protein